MVSQVYFGPGHGLPGTAKRLTVIMATALEATLDAVTRFKTGDTEEEERV